MADVDLVTGWTDVMTTLQGVPGMAGIFRFCAAVGVIIIVAAVLKMLWDKRKGGGAGLSSLVWPMVIGAVLAAPVVLIPVFLWVADFVINTGISFYTKYTT